MMVPCPLPRTVVPWTWQTCHSCRDSQKKLPIGHLHLDTAGFPHTGHNCPYGPFSRTSLISSSPFLPSSYLVLEVNPTQQNSRPMRTRMKATPPLQPQFAQA